jgi:site-specific DNA-methyltransferase (adenine-specific)
MSEGKKEILLGDCLELMKDIPNGSIDMILCDLPYGTTACKWDVIIPFDKLWEQYHRIIKDNGAIVLTASQPFTSALVMSNVKNFKYCWTWDKITAKGHLTAKIRPMQQTEDVCIFSKNKINYNPQMIDRPLNKIEVGTECKRTEIMGGISNGYSKKYTQWYPKTILRYKTERGLHPTQKPVALFEYLIKTYTNEGDLVLDNCAGSGTTAIACLNTNRQFIVMEKEQKYCDIILKRVGDI